MGTPPPAKKRRVADLLGISVPIAAHQVFKPDEAATVLKSDGSWSAAEAITKQMPNVGIPMTVLTGFLGAGKSTVLNYILRADHGLRIAVLINEFGAVDIDNQLVDTKGAGAEGDPIQLNNGCVCCTISNGFIDAVQRILDRPDVPLPHYFILETSGVADPKPIIDSVSNTELSASMYVDQVLTVIDSSSWTVDHYDSEAAASQLRWADTVLLSKTDLVKEPNLKNVINTLLDIKPNTRILKSQKGYVPLTALFDIDLTKSRVEDMKKKEEAEKAKEEAAKAKEQGHTHHDHKKDHEHENGHGKHEHEHKKAHDHEHKKDHQHEHKKDHDHKHENGHDKHEHDHKKDHDHEKHEHDHKKDHEHKHDHDHKKDDKHDHKHDHDHKRDHKHDHKHDHKDGEKSKCGHNHKPGEKCGHDHKKDKEKEGHLERDGFSSIAFTTEKSFSLFRFKNEFMEDLPEEVFRAKGLLYFKGYESRFVFHWSGRRFNVEEDEWPEGTKPSNQLVVIGKNLDEKAVTKMLEDCVTRPDDPDEDEFGNDPNAYGEEEEEETGYEGTTGTGMGMDMGMGIGMGAAIGMGMNLNMNMGMPIQQAQMMQQQQQQMPRNMMPLPGLSNPMAAGAGMGMYPAMQPQGVNLNANINHLLQQPIPAAPGMALPQINNMMGQQQLQQMQQMQQMHPATAMANKIPAISSLLAASAPAPAPAVVAPAVANATGNDEPQGNGNGP